MADRLPWRYALPIIVGLTLLAWAVILSPVWLVLP
jgi:hypothetical protein